MTVSNSSEKVWQWWAGTDEERYTMGPCATRDEVIQQVVDDQRYDELEPEHAVGDHSALPWRIGFYIVEATQHRREDLEIDGEHVLEQLDIKYEDWGDPDGDGNLITASREEVKDLGRRLTQVLHEWAQDKHLNAWAFADQRNEERVELPHPQNHEDEAPE